MSDLNLERLLENCVITKDTFEWLKPLHEKEEADREEIRLAAAALKNDPFAQCRASDYEEEEGSDDEDDDEDDILTISTKTLQKIEGTDSVVKFAMDINSTGHGDTVWHASIATCRYLKDNFLAKLCSSEAKSFRSLELGAGTAVPSLFLADRVMKMETTEKSSPTKICITDAKQYRNIKQILLSVGMQNTTNNSNVQFEVHPHNWGEFDEYIPRREAAGNGSANDYDLVIVSDCIYDPEYHEALLETLAHTLALGGRAVLSFSLHGNVEDEVIWDFVEQEIPAKTFPDGSNSDENEAWRLEARCVSKSETTDSDDVNVFVHREGWDMENTMKKFRVAKDGLARERWFSFVYEITWVRDEELE
mmetsp:Transcript_27722/g.75549  ORF Transcript_27722/g.75549 Transcript_27722/m.75549 type:complete len:363 (-) Transcript_27722:214-1302(-)|eukprot:CAMPEP_0172367678 /NCGR_PEP_ID=MMETSP1060-20121228/23014_1 /TAXON_ID=37318 /ORGANISM="Pseudo-nitzschia pungens, Strain cf. cingulata" /LENGTH=362 /DNA_ID=CAMNT_0013092011 /DNA_START=11 /DNA_END=1099 /DNA_ORIENTATION=+